MAKNKKKGFTLVELIVVIVIIGVLATIIVPIVTKSLSKGKEEYIDALQEEMILVAQDYYTENLVELPRGQLDEQGNKKLYSTVSVADLEANSFTTNKFVDPQGNSCEQSFVSVTNINGNYNYNVCVICGDKVYTTGEESCSVEAPDNPQAPITPQIPNPSCSIAIESPTDLTRLATITAITPNSSVNSITFVNDATSAVSEITMDGNVGTATLTASGSYTATVTNTQGQTGTCLVTIDPIPVYSEWSEYSTTACDTSNTDLCRTTTIYATRSDRIFGGRMASDGGYCCWGECYLISQRPDAPAFYSSCYGNYGSWSGWTTTSCNVGTLCKSATGYSSRTLTYN